MGYFKMTVKQVLRSKCFWGSMAFSLIVLIQPVIQDLFIYNVELPNVGIFGLSLNFGFIVFILPFLIAFPYARTFVQESKEQYLYYIFCRMNRKSFITAKIVAAAFIGGLLSMVPILVFAVLTSCGTCMVQREVYNFLPLSEMIWSEIYDLWGGILYYLGQILVAFLFGMVWGLVGLAFAVIFRTLTASIVGPFVVYYGLLLFSQQLEVRILDPSETLVVTYTNPINIFVYQTILATIAVFSIVCAFERYYSKMGRMD